MLTWTFMFFHTGTFAIINKAKWTATAWFTLCGVLEGKKITSNGKHYIINVTYCLLLNLVILDCVICDGDVNLDTVEKMAHTIIIVQIWTSSRAILSCASSGAVEEYFRRLALCNRSRNWLHIVTLNRQNFVSCLKIPNPYLTKGRSKNGSEALH